VRLFGLALLPIQTGEVPVLVGVVDENHTIMDTKPDHFLDTIVAQPFVEGQATR